MNQLTFSLCTLMLCISCSQSAPQALLSALLSAPAAEPPSSSSLSSSSSAHKQRETGLTTYDQKQSGKYNIHLNIKDVAIIALDAGVDGGVGDFGEDYYEDYDMSDFTVKPIFGIVDITSDKPTLNLTAPPLIHFDPDGASSDTNATSASGNGMTGVSLIEEPIIKDSVNKTQSITILNGTSNDSPNGIVVSTSTPAPEDLPPKLALISLNDGQNAQKPNVVPALFQTKPNEIPVHLLLDPLPSQHLSSRHRPNGQWRLKNRVRATANHNRRITPPPMDSPQAGAVSSGLGNNRYRKGSLNHAKRRNCVLSTNGQCQNSQRRFGSPTLNGILSMLSLLSPKTMEELE